jgi:hypothetical protein
LLFLFKHFTLSQILEEFIPTERERILRLPPDELRAGQAAITEILAMWPVATGDLFEAKGDVAKEKEENLLEALRILRELIVHRQGGDPAFSRPKRPPERPDEPVGKSEPLPPSQRGPTEALVAELETLWEVRERPFTSQVPLLGRWIVALRNSWNSVATKWYVRPLLSQQVRFNGAVVRALLQLYAQDQALCAQDQALHRENQTLNAHYWDDDALLALLAERCGALTRRVAELEARLAQRREEQLSISEEKASE